METKKCSRCKEIKLISEFNKDRLSKDGLRTYCKECIAEDNKKYRKNNPGSNKEYYSKNKEYWEKYYKNNTEHFKEYAKNNPEKIRENKRKWLAINPDYKKQWHINHIEEDKDYKKQWQIIHSDKCCNYVSKRKAKIRNSTVEHVDLFQLYKDHKYICGICGLKIDKKLKWPNLMCVSHDHIIPISKGGSHTYDNIQPSHFVCNISKGAKIDNIQLRLQTA